MQDRARDRSLGWLVGISAALLALTAHAQRIEPRSYANTPTGVNFLAVGYGHSSGNVLVDPSIPVADASARIQSVVLGYGRSISVFGQSGIVGLVVPWATVDAEGRLEGTAREAHRVGFGDPVVRLAVNLYGAPAMELEEFRGWRQDTIVGVSLTAGAPWGQYDPQKLVNVGTNRWFVTPEIGASKSFGRLTLEGALGVTVFGDNDQYLGSSRKEQEPIVSVQLHGIFDVRPGIWLALGGTYYTGGRTTIDGVERNDLQQNWRWGATLSLALNRRNSLKVYGSTGVQTRTGTAFDSLGLAWQYRFGGGL
jgi:hypothetical protein